MREKSSLRAFLISSLNFGRYVDVMPSPKPYFSLKKTHAIAHRGYSALFPENTMMAFAAAAKKVPYIELDVWFSRDGVPVVHHDQDLERMCQVSADITQLTLKEIKTHDAAAGFILQGKTPYKNQDVTIPTLEEVLIAFPDNHINIEVKHPSPFINKSLLPLLKKLDCIDRILVTSFVGEGMDLIRQTFKNLPVATGSSDPEARAFATWLKSGRRKGFKMPGDALQIPTVWDELQLDQPEYAQGAHELGMELHYWTINDAATMKKLIKMGADGIISDEVDLLTKL